MTAKQKVQKPKAKKMTGNTGFSRQFRICLFTLRKIEIYG